MSTCFVSKQKNSFCEQFHESREQKFSQESWNQSTGVLYFMEKNSQQCHKKVHKNIKNVKKKKFQKIPYKTQFFNTLQWFSSLFIEHFIPIINQKVLHDNLGLLVITYLFFLHLSPFPPTNTPALRSSLIFSTLIIWLIACRSPD